MASQKFAIRLSVEDAEKVRAALKGVGADGAAAMKVFGDAADRAAARTAGMRQEALRADAALSGIDAASRKARAGLDGLGDTVGRVRGGLSSLGLAGGLSAAATVSAATAMADAWTRMGNQITAAGTPMTDLADTQQRLVELSLDARTGLGSTVELYARLTRATAELGASQDDVFRATEILTKGMKAAGQSTSETQAAVLQLGQALASGVLQGDELRSLRENSPAIAQAIADEFGVTIGQLKELGAEGELTSDRVFRAILNAGDEIERQFATAQVTLGDAWTNIGTQATAVIGRLDEMYGVTYTWAQALKEGGDLLARIGGGAPGAPQNEMALRARGDRFAAEFRRVDAQTDPLFDPVDATRKLTDAETQLAEKRRREHLERLAALQAELKLLQRQNEEVLNREAERVDPVSELFGMGNGPAMQRMREGISSIIDSVSALERRYEAIEKLPLQAFVGDESGARTTRETDEGRARRLKERERLEERAIQLRAQMGDHTGVLLKLETELNELVAARLITQEMADERLQREKDTLNGVVSLYERMEETFGRINGMDVSVALTIDQTQAEEFLRQADELAMQLGVIDTPRVAEMRERIADAVSDGFRDGVADDNWGREFRELFGAYLAEVYDSFLRKFANALTDVMVDVARQAQSSDSGWLSDLAGFVIDVAAGGGGSTGGGGGGGNANTPGSLFAKGDVFTNKVFHRPTTFQFAKGDGFGLGMMAEERPEAVMPLERTPDGRLGVIAMGAGGGGGAPAKVEFHLHNYAGAEVEQRQSRNADGSERIDVYIKAKALEALQSGQGAKIMRDTYGVSRPATRR